MGSQCWVLVFVAFDARLGLEDGFKLTSWFLIQWKHLFLLIRAVKNCSPFP